MQHPLVLDTTKKFGRLTPVKSLGPQTDRRKRRLWEFQCDCGNTVQRSASSVKTGRTKSCGCLQAEYKKSSLKPTIREGLAGPKRKLYGRYRREAAKRGYDFGIGIEFFSQVILRDCYYCGAKPQTTLNISRVFSDRNVLTYNGIDRMINTVGYTEDNCVACCTVCNRIKMSMDHDAFIGHVIRIANYVEKKNEA